MKESEHKLPKIGHILQNKKISDDDFSLNKREMDALIARIAKAFTWKSVIYRGIVNGVFTAVGATLGIALLLLFLTRVYVGLQDLPIVQDFMRATGLDIVVEYAIEQTKGDSNVIDRGVTDGGMTTESSQ